MKDRFRLVVPAAYCKIQFYYIIYTLLFDASISFNFIGFEHVIPEVYYVRAMLEQLPSEYPCIFLDISPTPAITQTMYAKLGYQLTLAKSEGGNRPDCQTLVMLSNAGIQDRITQPSEVETSSSVGSNHTSDPITH
jgi:hypothetical protein